MDTCKQASMHAYCSERFNYFLRVFLSKPGVYIASAAVSAARDDDDDDRGDGIGGGALVAFGLIP